MAVQIAQPQNPHERERIYRFLYEIWSDEFSRTMDGMDHRHRLMKDSLDETARHFFAIDSSGRILGCVRINIIQASPLPEKL